MFPAFYSTAAARQNENVSKRILDGKTAQTIRPVLGDLRNRTINPRVDPNQNLKRVIKPATYSQSYNARLMTQMKKTQPIEEPLKVALHKHEEVDVDVLELSEAFSQQLLDCEDIDVDDDENPQLVAVYVKDIYRYLSKIENENCVEKDFLQGQKVTSKMRGVLIDWLVQVHLKFSLLQETLYLTVALVDRYLQSDRNTSKEKLQLIGVACMFIASKYEEMYIPAISDFAYITAKAYTAQQIKSMEVHVLTELKFYISHPLPLHFLRRNSKAGHVDAKQHTLAKYLMEITLPEYTFCWYKQSEIAAAALYLSMKLTKDEEGWTKTVQYYSTYSEDSIIHIVCRMACLVIRGPNKLRSIKEKYRSPKLGKISECDEVSSSNTILRSFALKAASLKSP